MNASGPTAAHLKLRPFQQEAVDGFFEPDAPPRQILLAPVGTGKSTTASAVIAEALRRGANGIAVLAPANVVAQGIAWRAATDELTPYPLHRSVSAITSASLGPRWPRRVITFGSLRQARREPIASALRARGWDIVIVDLSGAGEDDVDTLRGFLSETNVDRVLALNDARSASAKWSWLDAAPLAFSDPGLESVKASPIKFSVVSYERSPDEIDLASRAQQVTLDLRRLGVRVPARLPAAVNSSPLAAQSQAWAAAGSLRHLRNRLAHGLPGESKPKDGPTVGPSALPQLEQLRDALMRLGDDVDLLQTDAKWEAFLSEFEQRGAKSTVVFCDFAETAAYVANRLQGVGVDAMQLSESTGLTHVDERPDTVLVGRDELLLGLELRHAQVAYNYDLPRSLRRAHIRWSLLDWSRTDPPVEMFTMLDRRNASPTEKMSFTQFQYLVSGHSAADSPSSRPSRRPT